jgi:hypothetical protein
MKLLRIATIAAIAVTPWVARPALACMTTSGPYFESPARASHTDASHHHARHRAHRAAIHHSAFATPALPQPLRPQKSRPDHRAALPRVHQGGRTHGDPRTGGRLAATVPGQPSLLTVSVTRLDRSQNACNAMVGGCELSGRGPPRAPPRTDLPASLAPGPPQHLPPAAPVFLSTQTIRRTARFAAREAFPGAIPRPGLAPLFPLYQEPPSSCSHANRPEGAVA